MSKIWCFYHSPDYDGKCSGAIIYNYYKNKGKNVELFGINYGDNFPWTDITQEDTVYMVDFGLQPFKDMVLLNSICNLIWIDHHHTALNDLNESGVKFDGIQRDGIGACALVWEYMYPDIKIPYAIKLLSEYDVWIHTDNNTLPLQYGMDIMYNTAPNSSLWENLFDLDFLDGVILKGMTISQYVFNINKEYADMYAFDTTINGMNAIAINKGITSSIMFKSIWDEDKYDCMVTFSRTKDMKWTCSIYSDKEGVDVSITAKKYGGGGHLQAAGFQCDKLPFKY